MKKIAVYGSLKEGCYNHDRFDMGEVIGRGTIRGAMFLAYHSYPHLYREGVMGAELEQDHEVEIYNVSDEVYKSMESMELGAGYQVVEMRVLGHDVVVFFTRDDLGYIFNPIKSYPVSVII